MNPTSLWYSQLIKPAFAPPAWLFGPVWTMLYVVIAWTFGTVLYRVWTKELPVGVAVPFILNLVFNLAFSPIQFRLQSNLLATVDILLVLGTLIWALVAIFPHLRWVVYANIPYLLWVSFATVLQISITVLNWGR